MGKAKIVMPISKVRYPRLMLPLFPPSAAHRLPRGQPSPLRSELIRHASGHRWTHAKCTMNLDEVVAEFAQPSQNESSPLPRLWMGSVPINNWRKLMGRDAQIAQRKPRTHRLTEH